MSDLNRNDAVRLYGDPVLKKKCQKVAEVNRDIVKLINVMSQIMYQRRGIGLAAPQVGISKRVIVANVGEGLVCLVNPRIISAKGKEIMCEGCLSFPGIDLEIKRSREIEVEGLNERGEQIKMKAAGILSRVVQHEIDHLDGVLITDRVPKKRLKTIKKELTEIKKLHD
jgi:peptide deformylase